MEPTFQLCEDGVHFDFQHDCFRQWVVEGKPGRLEFRSWGTLPNGFDEGHWHVVQREPLTVLPSIHCLGCGTHGFITNGEWVSVA